MQQQQTQHDTTESSARHAPSGRQYRHRHRASASSDSPGDDDDDEGERCAAAVGGARSRASTNDVSRELAAAATPSERSKERFQGPPAVARGMAPAMRMT